MSQLEVVFDVPPAIQAGLVTGQLERVGGVIVESGSRQVVAWLRDGNIVEAVSSATASSLRMAPNLMNLMVTGQVINASLTMMSLQAISSRLERLQGEIQKLSEVMHAEFSRNRRIAFESAVETAQEAFKAQDIENRRQKAILATGILKDSSKQFLCDFDAIIYKDKSLDNLSLAQNYLTNVIYAHTIHAHCNLEIDEIGLAKSGLQEAVKNLRPTANIIVEHWLGDHPAIFFHGDVPLEILQRFFTIQRWLRNDDQTDDEATMLSIVDAVRHDFWNSAVIETRYDNALKRVARRSANKIEDRIAELDIRLGNAEAIIENFDRLRGFELEICSMRLEYREWRDHVNQLTEVESPNDSRLSLIYDAEMLERLQQPA